MTEDRRGEIITFYSFKGGVGRTMALANVAVIQAQRGKKVLALDFDFEAPGLHRYFLTKKEGRYTPAGPQKGVLDLFDALREKLRTAFAYDEDMKGAEAQAKTRAILGELLDSGAYLYNVRVANPNTKPPSEATVDFIAAAHFEGEYTTLLRSFNWQNFYDDYFDVFPAIMDELRSRYDLVLVDSRTGVTDIGSICTMVLPDKLVLAFTTNEQSLAGVIDAGLQAVLGAKDAPVPRVLPIFPLVSRVEEGEEQLKRAWIADARERFEQLFKVAYSLDECDLEVYFNSVRVSHRGYFAYGERIAAEEQVAIEVASMTEAFHEFTDCLDSTDVAAVQRRLTSSTSIAVLNAVGQLAASGAHEFASTLFDILYEQFADLKGPTKAAFQWQALFRSNIARVLHAKQLWSNGNELAARALLESAYAKLSTLVKTGPSDPTIPGMVGYAAFLVGREDNARQLLATAIKRGGAKVSVRDAVLKAAAVHPLPEDAAFRAMLASIPDPPAGSPPTAADVDKP